MNLLLVIAISVLLQHKAFSLECYTCDNCGPPILNNIPYESPRLTTCGLLQTNCRTDRILYPNNTAFVFKRCSANCSPGELMSENFRLKTECCQTNACNSA